MYYQKYCILYLFIFYSFFSLAGNSIALLDSIVIKDPVGNSNIFGFAKISADTIYFFDTKTGQIYVYNIKGQFLKNINIGNKQTYSSLFNNVGGFEKLINGFMLLNYSSEIIELFFYSDDGNLIKQQNLKIKHKSILSPQNNLFASYYEKEKLNIILPIRPYYTPFYKKGDYGNKILEYYQKNGLVAFIDADNNTIIKVIGKYDSIYIRRRFLEYMDNIAYSYDDENKLLFFGQEATHKIQIYNNKGNELKSFGIAGNKIDSTIPLPVVTNRAEFLSKEYHNKIISPSYGDIYIDKINKLTFRIYHTSIADTTSIDSSYMHYINLLANNKLKGCPKPNEQEKNQKVLMKSKPCYLQVYDNKNNFELLGEFALKNNNIKILKVSNNIIYILGYSISSEHIIYSYNLKNISSPSSPSSR